MTKKNQSAHVEGLIGKGVDVVDDAPSIEPVTQGDFAKEVADEAFMHEPVTILIFPSTDANAPPYALLNVNGDREVVPRAVRKTIKRKHLEVLARMKETRWVQTVPEGYVGAVGMESLRGHTALAYPFQVIEDKNPRGAGWLEHVMAEAH